MKEKMGREKRNEKMHLGWLSCLFSLGSQGKRMLLLFRETWAVLLRPSPWRVNRETVVGTWSQYIMVSSTWPSACAAAITHSEKCLGVRGRLSPSDAPLAFPLPIINYRWQPGMRPSSIANRWGCFWRCGARQKIKRRWEHELQ